MSAVTAPRPEAAAQAAANTAAQAASNNNNSLIKTAITVAVVAAVAIGVAAAFVFAAPVVALTCVCVGIPLALVFTGAVWIPPSYYPVYTYRSYSPVTHVVRDPVFVPTPRVVHARSFFPDTVVVQPPLYRAPMPRSAVVDPSLLRVPMPRSGHSSHSGGFAGHVPTGAHVGVGTGHFGRR